MPEPYQMNKLLKLQRILMTFNSLLKSIEVKLKSRESKNDIHKDLSVERRCVCGGGSWRDRVPHE